MFRPYWRYLEREFVTFHRLAGKKGRLPDFFVIGTQKGGTTTLYDVLCQHPKIETARTKELSFFDRYWSRGLGWYAANFRSLPRDESDMLTGEATPDYIFSSDVVTRMANTFDTPPKLIALLRHPTDRAISHYFHELRLGTETLPIAEAFAAEESRLKAPKTRVGLPWENMTNDFCFGYRARSHYAGQIKMWLDTFGRDALFVETSEKFFKHPGAVRDEIFNFLGLEITKLPDVKPRNAGTYREKVPQSLIDELDKYFAPDIASLEALTGLITHWRLPKPVDQ